jgi:hypothetical protein
MSDSKARRNPSIVANSKYMRGAASQDDQRRRRLETLTQDAEANARAKQEFAQISQRQLGRAAPVELDDVEARQRTPRYTVVSPEPAAEAVNDAADMSRQPKRKSAAEVQPTRVPEQQASALQSAAATGKAQPERLADRPSARSGASREMFAHVEHKPVVPPVPARPRYADEGHVTRSHPIASAYEEPWSFEQQVRSSRGLLVCALIIAVSLGIIWMLRAPERTFIGRGALPFGMSQDAASDQQAQQFPVSPGEHSVLGTPSISAAAIDAILAKYGSPAAGTGQTWVALGQHYGIDPAYAVAFFIHESSAGTNPGWAGIKSDGSTTHNVGNIICAGYATCYGRFRDYPSWDEGIGDWYKLISQEYVNGRGAASVEQIIPIYAPSFENDVNGYIQSVVGLVDEWRQYGAAQ